MSIFNSDDYNNETNNLENSILTKVSDNYLRKNANDVATGNILFNGLISLNNDLNLTNNVDLTVIDKNITSSQVSQLYNLDISKGTIEQRLSQTYSGNNIYYGINSFQNTNNFKEVLFDGDILCGLNSGVSIQPDELGYLNNCNSNVQNQLNNKLDPIISPINNNLVSMDNLGKLKNNGISILTDINLSNTNDMLIPSSKAVKTYIDNSIINLPPQVIGQSINYFFTNQQSGISNYEYIYPYPDNTGQDIEYVDCQNNKILIGSYITNNFNRTILNKGVFSFYFYAAVDDNVNYSYIDVEIYKRSNNIETLLLNNIKSNDINSIYPQNNVFIAEGTLANDITLLNNDEIVIKIFGGTNVVNKQIRIYFYHGGNTNSYFSTPLIYRHNDLSNLQGGTNNEYYHLSLSQYNNSTNIASSSNTGLLSNIDFNIFNNKQNNIPLGLSGQYYRYDKTFADLNKYTIGLNNIDNTSDLSKPISFSTQTALNLKNDIITSSSNLICNSISDISGNLRTDLNIRHNYIYVDVLNGVDDIYSGYSLIKPYKSIAYALTNQYISSGVSLILCPGTYNETNLICNKQNLTISSLGIERGGVININNLTLTHPSSSLRLSGLNIGALTINSIGSTYIQYCQFNTFIKNNSGYLEMNNSWINTSLLIDGNSVNNFVNNNNIGCPITISISSSLSQTNCSNNLLLGPIIQNSGILGINNSTIYSASSTLNAITTTNSSILYLSNLSILNPDNTNAKISINNISYYSINNVVYNKSSSLLLGVKLSRNNYFELLNCDSINGINSTTLNYLSNVSSDIQNQLNNISNNNISLSNNNIFTGTKTFNNINLNGNIVANSILISPSELSYLDNISSNIQNQINYKQNIINNTVDITAKSLTDATGNLRTAINTKQDTITNATNLFVNSISTPIGDIQTQLNNINKLCYFKYGFIMSNNIINPNTIINISGGSCSSTNDSSYALTNGVGSIDIGISSYFSSGITRIANTWYYIFLSILNGIMGYYIDTDISYSHKNTNIIYYRRIGCFRTDASSNIIQFIQNTSDPTKFWWKGYFTIFNVADNNGTQNLINTYSPPNMESYLQGEVINTALNSFPNMTISSINNPNIYLIWIKSANNGNNMGWNYIENSNNSQVYVTWSGQNSRQFYINNYGFKDNFNL